MARDPQPLTFSDFRGGRNGADPSTSLRKNQVVEAINVDWWDGMLGRRRGGATVLSLSGSTFTGQVSTLLRHVPADDETAAELWGVCSNNIVNRNAAGSWSAPTLKDAVSGNARQINGVSFNGKHYLAYDSAVNRLHVWDGSTVRRVGLARPSSAPSTSLSAGSVSDSRKYKTAALVVSSSVVTRRSELSDATGVVSPSAQQVTVTFAGAPNEGETHWELYAASDDNNYATYHYIGQAAIGATIADNNAALTGVNPADVGTYNTPPSCKYIVADDARLIMAGAWESAISSTSETVPATSRVWWTPIKGSLDVSDDERVMKTSVLSGYIDVDEPITGMSKPVNGVLYVFSYRSVWRLSLTGNVDAPYTRWPLSRTVGCIDHKSIVVAEDVSGNSTVYFLSENGPYRIGVGGLEYCGNDVEDIWATVNLSATTAVTHAIHHKALHQIWWYLAVGANNAPTKKIAFDTRLGRRVTDADDDSVLFGWAVHDGESAAAICSVMFSNTVGATMSRDLKPYIGRSSGTAVWKADTTDQNDNGNAFQAYFETPPVNTVGGRHLAGVEPHVFARCGSATPALTIIKDHGAESQSFTASLAAVGTETKKYARFDGAAVAEAKHVAFRIGDASAVSTSWTFDELMIPIDIEEAFAS